MLFFLSLAVGYAHVAAIGFPITMTDDYYLTVKTYERLYSIDIWAGDNLAVHLNRKENPGLRIDYHTLQKEWAKFYERKTYEYQMKGADIEEYTIYFNGTVFIVKSSFGLDVAVDSPYRMRQVDYIDCSMDNVSFRKCHKCNYKG